MDGVCETVNSSVPGFRIFNESLIHYEHDYSRFDEWKEKLWGQGKINDEETLKKFCDPFAYTKLRYKNINLHMCVWDPAIDIYVSAAIMNGKIWEEHVVVEMMTKIRRENSIMFDFGVNIGQFTLLAAYFNATVVGFEPMPQQIDIVQRSLFLNNLTKKVHLFRNAVSYLSKELKLNIDRWNKGGSYVSDSSNGIPIDVIPVDAVLPTLEKILGNYFKVDFMKVDIEGYEVFFTMGALQFIQTHWINNIILEMISDKNAEFKCDLTKYLNLWNNIGYTVGYKKDYLDIEYFFNKKTHDKESFNNFVKREGAVDLHLYKIDSF